MCLLMFLSCVFCIAKLNNSYVPVSSSKAFCSVSCHSMCAKYMIHKHGSNATKDINVVVKLHMPLSSKETYVNDCSEAMLNTNVSDENNHIVTVMFC